MQVIRVQRDRLMLVDFLVNFVRHNDPHRNSVFVYRQPFSPQVVIIIVLAYIMIFSFKVKRPHFEKQFISLTALTSMTSAIYQNFYNELGYNNMQ